MGSFGRGHGPGHDSGSGCLCCTDRSFFDDLCRGIVEGKKTFGVLWEASASVLTAAWAMRRPFLASCTDHSAIRGP
eukprot:1239396-Pyramimonas_sp.AAC.1